MADEQEPQAQVEPGEDLARAVAECHRLDLLVAEKDREIAALSTRLAAEREKRAGLAAKAFGEFLSEWGVRLRVATDGVHLVAE